jgi:CO/xanthine dehydrogenase Mo-binding subunit
MSVKSSLTSFRASITLSASSALPARICGMLPRGAEAFGWEKRIPQPRSMGDGGKLVGWGMATGVWEALQMPAASRIALTANGHAEVAPDIRYWTGRHCHV